MKTTTLVLLAIFLTSGYSYSQNEKTNNSKKPDQTMKTFIIEREIPGAGDLTAPELKGISQGSCAVLSQMGPKIAWQQSYVAGDKIYCIYKAENKDLIEEHARLGGFPANKITEVANVISPATAEN